MYTSYSRKDLVPGGGILWIEPAFELLSVAVVEDADHPRLHVDAGTSRTHVAHRTDVVVVAENIVLGQPEALCRQPAEPRDELLTSSNLSCHRVRTGDVPHNVGCDKSFERGEISRPEGVRGAAIGERIGMFTVHLRDDRTSPPQHESPKAAGHQRSRQHGLRQAPDETFFRFRPA
jgi:hypothetical protein